MKSLTDLWTIMANELAIRCSTSASRDIKTATARLEDEGFSFFTITLPAFAKGLEKALDQGWYDPSLCSGFRTRGELPLFLGGFLDRIFDRASGRLVADPCVESIYAVRQLCYLFAKIELPANPRRERKAIQGYINCEKEMEVPGVSPGSPELHAFERVAWLLFGNVFNDIEHRYLFDGVLPKHGPGSTADKLLGNKKFDQFEWPERLEQCFPFYEYATPILREFQISRRRVHFLEPGAERPVRVITVPKTLKTPRIIAIEPTCMQYIQQGFSELFYEALERPTAGAYFCDQLNAAYGLIGFTDQEPNQFLACKGSLDGDLATLDLSEASDRVSNLHVLSLFAKFPRLSEGIQACRSTKADVPGHGIVSLTKFASMGSALCFPVEAMVFLTIICLALETELSRPLTRDDIFSLQGKVRVYGDDIIVPVDLVQSVTHWLTRFGYVVNKSKSFWTGKFRESCGKEYYDGNDVSVIKFRRELPRSLDDAREVVSLVSFRNNAYMHGLWRTTSWLDRWIPSLLRGHYPTVEPTSSCLGRHTLLSDDYPLDSLRGPLQLPLVRAYTVKATPPASNLTGEGALLKWFLKRSETPFEDVRHLERYGRPDAVYIKLRSVPPF